MAVRVNILTTYNGAGNKKALRDLALMQKQATLAGNSTAAAMFRASAGMQRAGASMAKTGAFMSKNITLPVVAIGAVSVVMAAKFESSMKLIQTQAGGSAKDVKVLSAAVLELAAKGQHGPNELAASLYHLKSVGMDNATAMKALTQAERLASVGHADLEQTTNAVAGAYKSGIKGAQSFGQTVGTLNAIIGAGNLRMEDLNAALGTGFLVSAQTFGVSLTSVGAALAMMTSRGIPARRAAMALKMAFSGMAAPSDTAEKAMSKLHLSSKKLAETMRSGGMLPALTMLKEKLAGLSKTGQSIALTKMFGAKSSQAILTLLGNLKDYDRTQKQVRDNTGKFAELAAAQAKDADAKWAHFKSSMSSAAILIGNQLLPTAISLADRLGAVGAWLNKLSPGTRKWVVQLGLIVGVGGPVLLIVGKMTIGIGKLIGGMGRLAMGFGRGAKAAPGYARAIAGAAKGLAMFVKQGALALASLVKQAVAWAVHAAKQATYTAMGIALMVKDAAAKAAATAATVASAVATKAAAAGQWLLNAAMRANPLGLIITAIVALVAIFVVLWKKCDWFRNFWIGLWNGIKKVLKAVWDWIGPYLKAAWNKVVAVAKRAWPLVKAQIAITVAVIKGLIRGLSVIVGWVRNHFGGVLKVARTLWGLIAGGVRTQIAAIKLTVKGISVIVGWVRNTFGRVKNAVGGAWDWIKKKTSDAWGGVLSTVGGFVNKIIRIVNWLPGVDIKPVTWGGRTQDHTPAFAQGVARVSKPTLALIGEDGPEAVLPLSKPGRMTAILSELGIVPSTGMVARGQKRPRLPAFAEGGLVGDIQGFFGDLWGGVTGALGGLKGMVDGLNIPKLSVEGMAGFLPEILRTVWATVKDQFRSELGKRPQIVSNATEHIGDPYVWGGTSPGGFDCSGLVWHAYNQAGISIPRIPVNGGRVISASKMLPADVLLYSPGAIQEGVRVPFGHYRMFAGAGKTIESGGGGVHMDSLSNNPPAQIRSFLRLGGGSDGPSSGYPVTLHGRESVIAHDNPTRGLADLVRSGVVSAAQQGDTYTFEGCLFAQDFDTVVAEANKRGSAKITRRTLRMRGRV